MTVRLRVILPRRIRGYLDAHQVCRRVWGKGSNTVTRVGTPAALEDNEHVVREIARRFRMFLESGLATDSARWP